MRKAFIRIFFKIILLLSIVIGSSLIGILLSKKYSNREKELKEMKSALKAENPEKLLILGTSDEMVEKIVENLNLGKIDKKIYIEEISSAAQIETARKSRVEDGKHVVPVPTFEIKKQFSGYFLDSLKTFNFFNRDGNENVETEKTIIRPTYSYLGNFVISDNVINSIIMYTVSKIKGVSKVFRVSTQKYIDGMKLDIDIEIVYGYNIPHLSSIIRNVVIYAVDNATGINLFGININVKSIAKQNK